MSAPDEPSRRPWRRLALALLSAVGAYFFVASLVMTVALPFRYAIPMIGRASYPPELVILGLVTLFGTAAGAAIAYAYGGLRAFAIVAALDAAVAVSVIAPVAVQPFAWAPLPPDIEGVTTAFVLLASVLAAVPGMVAGLLIGRVLRRRESWVTVLVAAGAYEVTSIAMSLPTPQLDLRMALPYSGGLFTDAWRVAVVAVPAVASGLALGGRGASLWRTILSAGAIGLAAALPAELSALALILSPYVPTAIVGVPLATVAVAIATALAVRAVPRGALSSLAATPLRASALGVAGALIAVGAWSLLEMLPSTYDHITRIDAYRESGDERRIDACVTSGRNVRLHRVNLREDVSAVTVTVTLRRDPSWYFSDLVGIPLPVVISLRDPLASRAVIDGSSGERVRGYAAGTPWYC